jgi:ectoine hydroxylase-related dioxygenase (phytanoyl-CoA dioxygenase family)
MIDICEELQTKGYCIVEDILSSEEVEHAKTSYYNWLESAPQIKQNHNKTGPHGIFKELEVGHQYHAWYIRTRPKVQSAFKEIWKTEELVTSFDGSCWISADTKKKDTIWTHTDQAPNKTGLKCVQGFVALTDNVNRSLVVYEGSHLLHEKYAKEKNLSSTTDWLLIEHEYLEKIKHTKCVLPVKAGSLVLWDSRTFHQNQYGNCEEERIVQYVCFLPRLGLKPKMQEKRVKYFNERRTTSHWPYPVKVNGLQPQTYGKSELKIDYSALVKPDLEDLLPEIKKIL